MAYDWFWLKILIHRVKSLVLPLKFYIHLNDLDCIRIKQYFTNQNVLSDMNKYWHNYLQKIKLTIVIVTDNAIQALCGIYDNYCVSRQLSPNKTRQNLAIRLRFYDPVTSIVDQIRGPQYIDKKLAKEDFILRRRDGLFAYNLAVVLDDHYQGITEIVRGGRSTQCNQLAKITLSSIRLVRANSLTLTFGT